jgi:hypothetical protein
MKTKFLFPHQLKKTGWFLLVPGIMLGILYLIFEPEPDFLDVKVFSLVVEEFFSDTVFFSFVETNILNEITSLLIIIGALLVAFSKEKSEDEYISKIRLESLVWATYINYAILVLTIILIYDLVFYWVLVFNMFTLLIFFIIRFNWALYKFKKQISDEE